METEIQELLVFELRAKTAQIRLFEREKAQNISYTWKNQGKQEYRSITKLF